MSDPHGWINYWQLWESGRWEPTTRALLEELLAPGDLFVDIGAWIGPVTRWALACGAKVVAVEPDPVACAELRRLHPTLEIWEGAIVAGKGSGVVRLAPNARDGGAFGDSMSALTDDHAAWAVLAYSIDMVVGDRRPRLVKVDVEGYELELLPTLAPWCAAHGACLSVSWHGTLGERTWFDGFDELRWTEDVWGDLVAIKERP